MRKFLILILAFSSLVGAQKNATKDREKKELREEVVVVAERTKTPVLSLATSVEMISLEDIKSFHPMDFKEELFFIPSVYIPGNFSHGLPTSTFVRGVSSSMGIFALNSVPLTDPNTLSFPLDAIPAFFVSSVESVLGPQSALWGDRAMGFVSNLLLDDKKGSEVNVMFGGLSTINFEGKTGIRGKNYFLKGGYSYFNTDGVVENNSYKRNAAYFTSGFRWKSLSVNPQIFYSNQFGFIPFVHRGLTATDRKSRDKMLIVQVPVKADFEKFSFNFTPYFFYKQYKYSDPNDPWRFTNSYSDVKTGGAIASVSFSLTPDLRLISGAELKREYLNSRNNFYVQYKDFEIGYYNFWGNFVYEKDRFFISAGGGYSHSSIYGGEFTPKMGVSVWILKDRAKIRGSYGEGHRFPSPTETTGFWGNKNLLPEKSRGYEAGIDLLPISSFVLSMIGFRTDFKDLITYDYFEGKFNNIGKAKIEGWEILMRYYNKFFKLNAGITRLNAMDLVTSSKLLRRPDWMAKGIVSIFPSKKLTITSAIFYVGDRKDYDDKLFKVVDNPSYLIVNANIDYALWQNMVVYIKAHNLFNRKYQDIYGYPSPGRVLYAGFRFEF